jgi:hypothetical protein
MTTALNNLDAAVRSSHDALMERMQLYCLVLDAEGVLDELSDYDCYLARIAFSFDVNTLSREEAAEHLRSRVQDVLGHRATPPNQVPSDYDNPIGVARAFNIAATVVENWEEMR